MDEQAGQRDKVRELRGGILRLLQTAFIMNTSVTEETLKRHCMRSCRATAAHTDEAVAYLVATGLILREEERADALDNDPGVFFKLSPAGYRVVTGVARDDSVLLS